MDLVLRAKEKGIGYKVVHNASIMNAIGCCGLQVRRFSTESCEVYVTHCMCMFILIMISCA